MEANHFEYKCIFQRLIGDHRCPSINYLTSNYTNCLLKLLQYRHYNSDNTFFNLGKHNGGCPSNLMRPENHVTYSL